LADGQRLLGGSGRSHRRGSGQVFVAEKKKDCFLDTSLFVFLISVFVASLAGSFHCVGMCGGLMVATTQPQSRYMYHLGRGISYLILGFVAGLLGEKFYSSGVSTVIKNVATFFIVAILLSTGWQMFRRPGAPSWIGQKIAWISHKLFPVALKLPSRFQSFGVGIMTGALPCGWLYSFILLALAAQSLWRGGAILTVFWLGTIPALVFLTKSENWVLGKRHIFHRAIGVTFMLLAFLLLTQSNGAQFLFTDLLMNQLSPTNTVQEAFICH
jgi:sulfite exporter TauE/SafE